jgi:hypothetical protein
LTAGVRARILGMQPPRRACRGYVSGRGEGQGRRGWEAWSWTRASLAMRGGNTCGAERGLGLRRERRTGLKVASVREREGGRAQAPGPGRDACPAASQCASAGPSNSCQGNNIRRNSGFPRSCRLARVMKEPRWRGSTCRMWPMPCDGCVGGRRDGSAALFLHRTGGACSMASGPPSPARKLYQTIQLPTQQCR